MDFWMLSLCLSVIYTMAHVGNGEGNSVQTGSVISITVGVKNTLVVSSHETILVTCEAHGPSPGAKLLWNVDSFGTGVSTKVVTTSFKNQDGTIIVTIHLIGVPSREMNQKEVLCLARHPTLSQDKAIRYTINVHYPPQSVKISEINQGLDRPKGFECSADANPQPTYAWIREDQSLPSSGLRTEGNKLEFSPEMYGLYTCEVINPYGIAKSHMTMYTAIAGSETPLSVMLWILLIILITIAVVFVIILLFHCKRKKLQEYPKVLIKKLQSSSPI